MTELKDIMAISGYPGLFRFVAQGRNGVIVESLVDGKRMNAGPTMKISSLEDISVFTNKGEVKLEEVLKKLKDHTQDKEAMDPGADKNILLEYFGAVIPDFDRQKVYASDIKKILSWYNLLHRLKMLDFLEKKEEETPEEKEMIQTKPVQAKKDKPELRQVGMAKQKPTGAKKIQKPPAKKPAGN